jgi:cell division protein FtsL
MKRPVYVLAFIITIIVALAIAQVSIANQLSTTGAELGTLQQEVDTYKRENAVLQQELLEASSFTTLSKQAEDLGFIDAKVQISLTEPLPLALNQ